MSVMFDPSEIFQLAIRIEENGERFYQQMAAKAKTPALKELFAFLAGEEIGHKNYYQEVLSGQNQFEPFESYPGEYLAYLRSYAGNIIFDQKKFDDKVGKITSTAQAIDFAIGTELDSIFYYQEIKQMITEKKQNQIDQIINEERQHFIKLSDLKKNNTL